MKPIRWLITIIAFTLITLAGVYLISGDSTLYAIRYVLSFIFVAFLPGYCLVNILFVKGDRLDLIEELVLSVALSFGLAGIAGLFLGLSPLGIYVNTVTVTLSALTLALAAIAYIRKIKILREPNVQSTQ
ncbi:MAG: DUF1616 domain-containing protein [Candidatus Bathyarchaeota archaeon]|nr:DUF1616 domain-containing protein [Candidatus Bathyarchaeota archaeon]